MPRFWSIGIFAFLALCANTQSAAAENLEITPGSVRIDAFDSKGDIDGRAGSHPDVLKVGFSSNATEGNTFRDIRFNLPPGLVGDPGAVPTCPRAFFDASIFEEENGGKCPPETQVGVTRTVEPTETNTLPLFNIEPAPGEVAAFGVRLFIFKVIMSARISSSDYGLVLEQRDAIDHSVPVEFDVELWGVPADHQVGTDLPRRAFLTTPTRCDHGPMSIRAWGQPWRDVGVSTEETGESQLPLVGCELLPFDPRISVEATSASVDEPTGLEVELEVPQGGDPDGLATSHLKSAEIALPEGVVLSPGGAVDRVFCTDSQLRLGMEAEAECPAASRVGAIELLTPQLARPMSGAIYLGDERPGDRYRLFMVARAPEAEAKLVGSVVADAATGGLTVAMTDLPEMPLSRMSLKFAHGPRSLLASPISCGRAAAVGTFEPFSGGHPVVSIDSVTFGESPGGGCGAPRFLPKLDGGSTSAKAGRSTGLSVTVGRRSGEALADRFSIALPPGLSARLGSVTPCGGADAASGGCPAESRIGSAVAEIGSGPEPVGIDGAAYLTGPYRRAPFGLALVFRPSLGPFDLRTLTVRGTLEVDSRSGQVTVKMDSLPRIIEGFPVRFQTIGLDIDRRGFMVNPTSCRPMHLEATIQSTSGTIAHAAAPFAVRRCDRLQFDPAMAMKLTGSSRFQRGGRPGLRITIRPSRGGANLRSAKITLPSLLRFDGSRLKGVCALTDAIGSDCPATARIGTAKARTPMLGGVIRGSIYVVQPSDGGPPDIWTSLEGKGVNIDLRSSISVKEGRMRTEMKGLPDVPLSSLGLEFSGGKDGVLLLKRSFCGADHARHQRASMVTEGQNGAYRHVPSRLRADRNCSRAQGRREGGSADRGGRE